jgi:hypothetical protein
LGSARGEEPAGAGRRGRRAATAAASSMTPAIAVMAPMPETAPRTNGLPINGASTGRACAIVLRDHKADHGATIRIRPASRKYAAKRIRVRKEMISLRSARVRGDRRGA